METFPQLSRCFKFRTTKMHCKIIEMEMQTTGTKQRAKHRLCIYVNFIYGRFGSA